MLRATTFRRILASAFRFPDVTPGQYEASFGHYESDGSWVSRGSTRIEVRSGETTSVDL